MMPSPECRHRVQDSAGLDGESFSEADDRRGLADTALHVDYGDHFTWHSCVSLQVGLQLFLLAIGQPRGEKAVDIGERSLLALGLDCTIPSLGVLRITNENEADTVLLAAVAYFG